jgi:ribose transport system ATP-binding protein
MGQHTSDILTPSSETPVVELRGASKTFGPRRVLADADLILRGGTTHALLGHNGSGKSTLVKILSGYHAPDTGATLSVRGEAIRLPLSETAGSDLGFAFVHQDLGLIDAATVLENLRIGRFDLKPGRRIDWGGERRRGRIELDAVGLRAPLDAPCGTLAPVERALLAVARALGSLDSESRPGLLVLDEPTVHLPSDDVGRLWTATAAACARGHAVLLVTHRLNEVVEVADEITVLRDGVRVAHRSAEGVDEAELARLILGHGPVTREPAPPQLTGAREAMLVVRGLRCAPVDCDLDVAAGEIVGLTGLQGSGTSAVVAALFGARPATGSVELDGQALRLDKLTPSLAMQSGIAYLPADRRRDGGVAAASVAENVTLPVLGSLFRRGWTRRGQADRIVRDILESFDVRPREPNAAFGALSGGNQQKVLLGKWFGSRPKLLLVDEPTQGVDVGAREQIHHAMRQAAHRGLAIVLASVEHDGLCEVCDRVLVLHDGRIVAEFAGEQLQADAVATAVLSGVAA